MKRMKRKTAHVRKSRKNCLRGNLEMIRIPIRTLESRMSNEIFVWRSVVVIISRPRNLQRASHRCRREFPGK
jgi:hypothetical protein